MDTFAAGLATIANGALNALSTVENPIAIALGLSGLCFSWLALIEIHEMDRMGVKPNVVRH